VSWCSLSLSRIVDAWQYSTGLTYLNNVEALICVSGDLERRQQIQTVTECFIRSGSVVSSPCSSALACFWSRRCSKVSCFDWGSLRIVLSSRHHCDGWCVGAVQRTTYASDQQLLRMKTLIVAKPASGRCLACPNAADTRSNTVDLQHNAWSMPCISDSPICRRLCLSNKLRTMCSTRSITTPALV